eukprot:GHRR01002593.1.p1 GENE.GHRR01002593.1~~GHRR01002593.1.p1  ORF type:complete len:397 (+),score=160.38 GHRR01002593.1:469-1659(+)
MRSVTASQLAQPRAAATTGVVRARDDSCRRALWHVCRAEKEASQKTAQAQSRGESSTSQAKTSTPLHSSSTDASSTNSISSISGSSSNKSTSSISYGFMAALAAAGTAETAYLTINKLYNASVACPTGGCDTVLNSSYAQLFGLPLPLFGAGAYGAVAVAALVAAQAANSGEKVPGWLTTGLAAGVAVLATTSSYLMYVLQTQLGGASCVWCYASAGLSVVLFIMLLFSMGKRQLVDAAGPGLGAVAATIAALYIGFGPNTGVSTAADLEMPYVAPTVNTQSSEETITLAKRLREAGAKMYGAFWCSHCYDQKQEFGQQAMSDFPYVECFPEGWKKGVKIADACEAAMVKAFPTWVIGTQVTEGQLEIAQLEQLLDAATAPAAPAESPVAAAAASQ